MAKIWMIRQICNKAYIGQTSRDITHRYREHIRYIRNNDPPIRLRRTYFTQHTWIRQPHRNDDITETHQQDITTHPLRTVINTNVPSDLKCHTGTTLLRPKPVIATRHTHSSYITSHPHRSILQLTVTVSSSSTM